MELEINQHRCIIRDMRRKLTRTSYEEWFLKNKYKEDLSDKNLDHFKAISSATVWIQILVNSTFRTTYKIGRKDECKKGFQSFNFCYRIISNRLYSCKFDLYNYKVYKTGRKAECKMKSMKIIIFFFFPKNLICF